MKFVNIFLVGIALFFVASSASAQFNLDGQFLQRAEYRNGYNSILAENQEAAVFITQRARLQAGYKAEKLNFFVSIQDIRTFGSTPQIKATDGFLSVHEAWAETNLTEKLTLKVGRQELNYDNFRFLGNLDWAMQARAHDFALLKYEKDKAKFHLGFGFNQQEMKLSGTTYTLANQYKTAQMARYENEFGKLSVSLLLWNEGREQGGKHFYRQTFGIPTLRYKMNNTTFSAFFYGQAGKTIQDKTISAYNVNFQIKHQINFAEAQEGESEPAKNLQFAAGFEMLSGTKTTETTKSNSYAPLYGTNHAHNGYMDLFFVGGAFENSVGLNDFYAKIRQRYSARFFAQLDFHFFQSNAAAYNANQEELSKGLGSEIDFSFGFNLNKSVSLQGGYSQFFAGDTYKALKVPAGVEIKSSQNWAYLMLVVRPTMKNKFVGILF
jgi:hypothetical protein